MKSSLDLLLVDASPPARYALRLLLQRHGNHVRTAESAERALEIVRDGAPDAVLTACVLPGMNGLELLELLRTDRATAQIPLVICCPDGSWPLAETALQRGALAVLRRDRLKQDLPQVLARIETALAATVAQAPAPAAEPAPEPALAPAPASAQRTAPAPSPEPAPSPAPQPTSARTARPDRLGALARVWQRWRRQSHPLTLGVVIAGLGMLLLELLLHRP